MFFFYNRHIFRQFAHFSIILKPLSFLFQGFKFERKKNNFTVDKFPFAYSSNKIRLGKSRVRQR